MRRTHRAHFRATEEKDLKPPFNSLLTTDKISSAHCVFLFLEALSNKSLIGDVFSEFVA